MELYLQFGYGMKSLTLNLSKLWNSVTTILSPRDMTYNQLKLWSKEFSKNNVKCLFDPQCYCPKEQLKRLSQYPYWNQHFNTNLSNSIDSVSQTLIKIKECNDIADTESYIIPNTLFKYDDNWSRQWIHNSSLLINKSKSIMNDKPRFMTLTLPEGLLQQSEDVIEPILQTILQWDVDGFYIIAESINQSYLIENPLWLSNVFNICAALKLNNKKVIYGYGNHQFLPLSLAKVDAIASGTWLNVRSFTNRFKESIETKKRSTWIYYPPALSEYKLSFMDYAFSSDKLRSMPFNDKDFINEHILKIYQSNVQPSSTTFNETDAFFHYLICLRHQLDLVSEDSYKKALSVNEMILNTAETEIERLEKAGIYAQNRSFAKVIDVNRAAIKKLDNSYGFSLNMDWNTI